MCIKSKLIYPSDTPETPGTPAKGKGLLGVTISVPVPLPSHTPHQNPGVLKTPVILYIAMVAPWEIVIEWFEKGRVVMWATRLVPPFQSTIFSTTIHAMVAN